MLTLFQQGRIDEALASGQRAVERLEPFGETWELAGALRQLGQFHWRRGDSAEADAYLRRAVAMAGRVGATDVRAAAMQDLGVNLSQTGHPMEALETLEIAFQLAKEVDDPINLQRAYNNFASTLADFGSEYPRALEVGREGLAMARRGGGFGWLGWIEGTVGEVTLALGDLDEAEQMTRDAVEHGLSAGDEPLIGLRYMILAEVLGLRGRLDEAEAAMEASDRVPAEPSGAPGRDPPRGDRGRARARSRPRGRGALAPPSGGGDREPVQRGSGSPGRSGADPAVGPSRRARGG